MTGDGLLRAWTAVVEQALGDPVSVAHVCAAAVAGIGVDGASVTLMIDAVTRDMSHATDRVSQEIDEWQLTFGEGPCLDAFAAGGPVLVGDLREPEYASRWSAYTPAALRSGALAVFALPVQVGAIRLGTLNLYRAAAGTLGPDDLAAALALADLVGVLLLDDADGGRTDGARPAWARPDPTAHHAQVHQATGMILIQLGVSVDVAFVRLRAYAYAQDRRLGDVARDVVERRLRFQPDPPLPDLDEV